jgi:hypothetical protein
MIDYYYEIAPGAKVFNREVKYLAIYDIKPYNIGWRHLHESALAVSTRVWLQNSNGAALIRYFGNDVLTPISDSEFTWIKLQALDLEQL